ncbi:MAG TPA: cytochrome P450, partial [Enhygromyxa sp.]|nr:cytochrome P450 [Enhygromyxa sp.]
PDLHAALRADPSLVPSFVDEMLRFDGPTHMLMRLTTRDVEVHGVTIPAYSPVGLMIGAANRDPSHFEDPDTFKLDRNPRGALAFGHGPHVCIGAALAKIEGKVFLRELTRRFSRIELSSETRDWNLALHVRGLSTLAARLHA